MTGKNVYFGGKLVVARGVTVAVDRLGTVRANSNGESFAYYPYGEERTSTADGREKFGTYVRDNPNQDYADQRYYNVGTGRFNVPDPGGIRSADPTNPGKWNRYTYTHDPINFNDRFGLDEMIAETAQDCINDPTMKGCHAPCSPQEDFITQSADPDCYAGDGGGGPEDSGNNFVSGGPCPTTTFWAYSFNCIHRSGSDWGKVKKQLKLVAKLVGKDDGDCFAFLSGKVGAGRLDFDLKHITDYYQMADSITESGVVGTIWGVEGAGINGIDIVISDATLDKTPYDMRLILLHELAHMVRVIADDGVDPTNEITKANNAAIEANCSKTLHGGR
jgi:RHS repeat-associated protein